MPSLLIYALIAAVGVGGLYLKGKWDGDAACTARHEEAQREHEKKVNKSNDKIKRNAPTDADRATGISWLLDRTRQ